VRRQGADRDAGYDDGADAREDVPDQVTAPPPRRRPSRSRRRPALLLRIRLTLVRRLPPRLRASLRRVRLLGIRLARIRLLRLPSRLLPILRLAVRLALLVIRISGHLLAHDVPPLARFPVPRSPRL